MRKNLPIVIGAGDKANKCVIGDMKNHRAYICWLKENADYQIGDDVVKDSDIDGVYQELWFANQKSLQALIEVLNKINDNW